jgi:hypothetical protein
MGRQIEEIISSLGPLTGGTASINMNLVDIEALLTTLQADVADGIMLDSGSANNGQLGIASDGGGSAPNNGVQIGYHDVIGDAFTVVKSNNPLPVNTIGSVSVTSGTTTPLVSTTGGTGPTTFTSTSYGTIAIANSARLGCQIFSEGPGNLHVTLGTATTSTSSYTVRLASGDYYEVPSNYTGLIGGIFATSGTARVTQVS